MVSSASCDWKKGQPGHRIQPQTCLVGCEVVILMSIELYMEVHDIWTTMAPVVHGSHR